MTFDCKGRLSPRQRMIYNQLLIMQGAYFRLYFNRKGQRLYALITSDDEQVGLFRIGVIKPMIKNGWLCNEAGKIIIAK